jgi:AraC-like DNA-binding protein
MGDILRQSLFAHMPIIRDIVYGVVANGGSLQDMCSKLKINVADLDDSEKHADFETSCRSWEHAVKVTGDPLLGLHIGQSSNPSIMGLVGHLMQNSKTLLDAFKQVSEYGKIATNMFDYQVVERKDEIILRYAPVAIWRQLYPNGARQATDQAMAGTLNVFYLLGGKRVYPQKAEISKRKITRQYEEVFKALTVTGTTDQLTFKRHQLLEPVLRYDRSLFKAFEGLVRQKRKPASVTGQIRQLIINEFKGITPPVEIAAARLNITVRSLQRRLSAEKTSFRRISGQVTKEIAEKLLKQTDYKVADIAGILGYSAPRSFRRAYKELSKEAPSHSRLKGYGE